MRGAGELRLGRGGARALTSVLLTLPTALVAVATPAQADSTTVPGTMSTAAQDTSTFEVHVPAGVDVRAITGVLTMPEVIEGGTVTFRINGAVRTTVPSALYQKVRIPVDPPDVIANGTIGLTLTTEGPVPPGAACVPAAGVASMRKIGLDYRGAEVAPTSLADFFPASSSGITVVIPQDADSGMITAGLTAVAALVSRYDDETPVDLALNVPDAATATAGQRVVALTAGPRGDVTTAVSTASGIPMLTLTGAGEELVDAARALSIDTLGISGADAQNPSLQTKPRSTDKSRTFEDLGLIDVTLSGYGSVTRRLELRQDSFGTPVSSMTLHLEGSHTAFSEASGARLDVRANGALIGSVALGDEATFSEDIRVPAGTMRSVNDIDLTLNAVAPDGSACTPASIPPAEVDLDTTASTVTVAHGTGQSEGFQLFPQIYEGTLPVALRSAEGQRARAAINAAALVAALQRAAGSPLEIQLMSPDAFLADDRSGLMVGALAADSEALDAPLKLSSTRLLDREDSTQEVTSQDPYAVLESIDRNDRLVLMLGSWAPGNKAAPGELARKVVEAVVNTGWDRLDGDLVIGDATNPAFVTASESLAPHQQAEKEKSYAKWFVLVIVLLLLLLALQVVVAIRRDRRLARERDDYEEYGDEGPAYVEDDEYAGYQVDALGDVDDLEVHDYAGDGQGAPLADQGHQRGYPGEAGEYAASYEDEYEEGYADADLDETGLAETDLAGTDWAETDWDDEWGEEAEEIGQNRSGSPIAAEGGRTEDAGPAGDSDQDDDLGDLDDFDDEDDGVLDEDLDEDFDEDMDEAAEVAAEIEDESREPGERS